MDMVNFREVECELQQRWKDQEGEELHAYIEKGWSPIRESLIAKSAAEAIELEAFESRLERARDLAVNLFCALHQGFVSFYQNERIVPSGYWHHQQIEPLKVNRANRPISINKDELSATAARYLGQPDLQTNAFDWYLLDALVFVELDAFAYHCVDTKMGTGFNWAAMLSNNNEGEYLVLASVLGVVEFMARYIVLPLLAAYLFFQGHEGFGLAVGVIWTIAVVIIHHSGTPSVKRSLKLIQMWNANEVWN